MLRFVYAFIENKHWIIYHLHTGVKSLSVITMQIGTHLNI
jgi:hypothetical protein